jgi:hypothetical protein
MQDLCRPKYKNYKIYLHNFSKFDGIFLLKHLASFLSEGAIVDPIIHDGKLIQISFYFNECLIYFRDSYLLLPSSLNSLCKSFNLSIELSKTIFPILFNNIDYEGSVPDFNYFKGLSYKEFEQYKIKFKNQI